MSLVEKLAIYNDKGIAWSRHDQAKVDLERDKLIKAIQDQIELLGESKVSSDLIMALRDGSLKSDVTGKYIEYAKAVDL